MSHGYEEAPKSFEFAWRAFVQRLSLAAVEIIMPSDGRLSSFNIRQGLASRTFLGHVQYGRQLARRLRRGSQVFEFAWRAFVQRLPLAAVEVIMPSDGLQVVVD